MTTTSGSPEELPVVEPALPNGSSGSVGVEDELIVSLMGLVYYQLSIRQSLDQRFLNHFYLFLSNIHPSYCSLFPLACVLDLCPRNSDCLTP